MRDQNDKNKKYVFRPHIATDHTVTHRNGTRETRVLRALSRLHGGAGTGQSAYHLIPRDTLSELSGGM